MARLVYETLGNSKLAFGRVQQQSASFDPASGSMPGKRIQFNEETLQALTLLAGDRGVDFQTLADEAFRDLLRKHGRPTSLKAALRQSVGGSNVHPFPGKRRARRKHSGK
jgi:hypothetical protein